MELIGVDISMDTVHSFVVASIGVKGDRPSRGFQMEQWVTFSEAFRWTGAKKWEQVKID